MRDRAGADVGAHRAGAGHPGGGVGGAGGVVWVWEELMANNITQLPTLCFEIGDRS